MENIKETDLILTVVIGSFTMLLMVAVIVWAVVKYQRRVLMEQQVLQARELKYQNEILDATITASEKERVEVSKNIHDEIGTYLNVIKQNHERLNKNISNSEVIKNVISTNNQLLDEIIESVRSISNNLASPTLRKLGFIKALSALCSQMSQSGEVRAELIYNKEEDLRFESKAEMQLFRVCKEVVNNLLKHSGASNISVKPTLYDHTLKITIEHNGKGITDNEVVEILKDNKGLGLKSIYGRVQVLGGSIHYNNDSVVISLPVNTGNYGKN